MMAVADTNFGAKPMHNPPRIVCFSRDVTLCQTRRWILQRRYDTTCILSLEELQELEVFEAFDAVIFCHSLSPAERHLGIEIARVRWPDAKIVTLAASSLDYFSGEDSDEVVMSSQGPEVLMYTVAQMLTVGDGHELDTATSRILFRYKDTS
jgi:hypothetical protein